MNIREMARTIGVSPSTVSIVLNDRPGVSDSTRKKVQSAIDRYGYEPSARQRARRTAVLILLYRNSGSLIEENEGFISRILDSVEAHAASARWNTERRVIRTDLAEGLREISYAPYAGVILIASEITMESFEALEQIPIPFVALDNALPNVCCPTVVMNNDENVYLALDYLRRCGHGSIGYFRSSAMFVNFLERADAFYTWVEKNGFNFDRMNEIHVRPAMKHAAEDVRAALKGRADLPSCFFADNDSIALGAVRALKDLGWRVPEDVSIIGFDDIPFSAVSSPGLTTVHVQRDLLGKLAVDALAKRIGDPAYAAVKYRVTGELVVRGSVRTVERTDD